MGDALSPQTACARVEVFLAQGHDAEAAELGDRLVERHPGLARAWWLAGRAAYRCGEFAVAEARFGECERLHPDQGTRAWRGRSLARLGRLDEAEGLLSDSGGPLPGCATDLAWVYARRGDPRAAVALLDRHLALHPEDTFARSSRAELAGRATSPADALAEAQALLELGEEVPDAILGPAVTGALARGETELARGLCAGVAPGVRLRLAWAAKRAGADELAYELFTACLPLTDLKAHSSLGAIARRLGRQEDLATRYDGLGKVDPAYFGRARKLRG